MVVPAYLWYATSGSNRILLSKLDEQVSDLQGEEFLTNLIYKTNNFCP
jgi:hypothetical protein